MVPLSHRLFAAAALLLLAAPARAELTPRSTALAGDDLRISGMFRDVPIGAVRFLPRSALVAADGVVHLHERPAESIPAADLVVIRIDRLLQEMPLAPGADGIVLICADHWETFLPRSFIDRVHPYLLLKYAGRTPEQGWPQFGPTEAIAPYYCNASTALGPPVESRNEYGEFDATQVVELRAVNSGERYAPFYAGPLARLTPAAAEGRKLFLRECNNCHQGPAGVGGNTSQRPFTLLQTHAALNADYFRTFVRNPKQFYPQTVMPAHPYFMDAITSVRN
jgi:mono/diheme cytochrome c family protein